MGNVNAFLRENLARVSGKRMTIAPDIPDKKLNNAVASFKYDKDYKNILAIYDNTLLNSGKDGLLFTGELFIVKESFEDPVSVLLSDMEKVEYINEVTKNEKGKEKTEEYTLITQKNGSTVKVKNLLDGGYAPLAEILQEALTRFDDFTEENQILTLAEMSESLKIAYVKILILAAKSREELLRPEESAEILQLMTRLQLTPEARIVLRVALQDSVSEPLGDLLTIINTESPASQNKSVRISLVKDLVGVFIAVTGKTAAEFSFLNENKTLFELTDGEIELAVEAVLLDRKLLEDGYGDDLVTKGMKELAAKAASVGVPITAVYLSGSVVGLSAAGLTSGLATLGLGGVLGFSGMVTGIGVAVLLGLGAYKGVRHFTGADELDKIRRRELMLNDIIKHTQKTIFALIEDINHIAGELNNAILTVGTQDAQIRKLATVLASLGKTASALNKKESNLENQKIKLRCPSVLDLDRLALLTTEVTKKDLYDFILGYYEESVAAEGENAPEKKWIIRLGITTAEIEKLAKAFEAIGYFNTSDVILGKAGDAANKAKEKLSGLFR